MNEGLSGTVTLRPSCLRNHDTWVPRSAVRVGIWGIGAGMPRLQMRRQQVKRNASCIWRIATIIPQME